MTITDRSAKKSYKDSRRNPGRTTVTVAPEPKNTADFQVVASVLDDTNLLSGIFAFLHWKDILRSRVCRTWREAARLTDVPQSMSGGTWQAPDLNVKDREFAKALGWLSTELPKIPSVNILFNVCTTKAFEIADGENPDPKITPPAHIVHPSGPVDISPVANFRHLRQLSICGASLNGSYPYLFKFPHLQTLELIDVRSLVWDLEMLQGLPKLEKLTVIRNTNLTGNLSSIRVIRKTLVKLSLIMCFKVGGDLMDLRDFPLLTEICLHDCNRIGGDIRKIQAGDFRSVQSFGKLPDSVFGGAFLPSIAHTPAIMNAWYVLKKQNPCILSRVGNGLIPRILADCSGTTAVAFIKSVIVLFEVECNSDPDAKSADSNLLSMSILDDWYPRKFPALS
eukprot:CCRYP_016011-RA/>CCRYP_016011-RA protein AED:0.38 eAED:1.00 QI:0/0/0/1/1/1/2/0/393